MWIVCELRGIKAMIIPIIITVYCIQEKEGSGETPFGNDADSIAVM